MRMFERLNEQLGKVFVYQGHEQRMSSIQQDLNGQFWVGLSPLDDPDSAVLVAIEDWERLSPAARPS